MDNQSRYSSDLHSWSVRPSCRKPGNTSLPNPQALVSGILRPEGCRKPSQYSSSRRKNAGNLCGSDSAAAVYVVWFFLFLSPLVLTFTWWGCYSLRLWHKPTELANSFLFCFCVCFCLLMALSTVFHSINSPNNSPFSHSVLVVLALPYWSFQLCLFMKVSFSPDIIPSGWLGSKYQITNFKSLVCTCCSTSPSPVGLLP